MEGHAVLVAAAELAAAAGEPELGDGRAVIDRAVTEGRRQAAVSLLAHLLQRASRHDATADRWTAAAAGYHEAIGLARDTGYGTDLAATLAGQRPPAQLKGT
jgi:hypothetical protein